MAIYTFPFPNDIRRAIFGTVGAAVIAGTGVAALAGAFTHSGEASAPAVASTVFVAAVQVPPRPIERPRITYIVTSDQFEGEVLAQFAARQGLKDIVLQVVTSQADRARFETERMSIGAISDFVVVDVASY